MRNFAQNTKKSAASLKLQAFPNQNIVEASVFIPRLLLNIVFVKTAQAGVLRFSVAAENVNELVSYKFFNVSSCGLKIFSGVELFGVFCEKFANSTCHSKTKVGVDVDLAYGKLCSFTELFFGNTDSAGHIAAEFINHFNIVLGNRRRAVKNDGEAGKSSANLFEDIEAELGLCAGLELVCAVAGTDSDCKGVNAGLGYKFFNFFGTGVGGFAFSNYNVVFDTCEGTELTFYYYAVSVSIFNYLFGKVDVILEGMGGAVDHNRGKAAVDAGFAGFEVGAMVKVKNNGNFGAFKNCCFNQFYKVSVVCISTCALGNLKYNGSLFFSAGFGDTLNDFHVVNVESADGVAAFIGFLEHFC